MPDIRTAQSATLAGQARVKKWSATFIRSWMQPYADEFMILWWARVPPAMKAEMKALNPKEYAEVERRIGGLNGQ